jgi:3-hydroxyisobutyrate dehydrogenase-like beta-hydroxyacid dehydrogenase
VVSVHLPDETAVEEALFDCGGVGESLRDGGFVVAASATGPTFVLSAADRLGALGLNTVEAWFTGHSGGAPDTVLVGCAAEELEALARSSGWSPTTSCTSGRSGRSPPWGQP